MLCNTKKLSLEHNISCNTPQHWEQTEDPSPTPHGPGRQTTKDWNIWHIEKSSQSKSVLSSEIRWVTEFRRASSYLSFESKQNGNRLRHYNSTERTWTPWQSGTTGQDVVGNHFLVRDLWKIFEYRLAIWTIIWFNNNSFRVLLVSRRRRPTTTTTTPILRRTRWRRRRTTKTINNNNNNNSSSSNYSINNNSGRTTSKTISYSRKSNEDWILIQKETSLIRIDV